VIQSTKKATETRIKRGHYKAAKATGEMLPGEILDRDAFCKRFGTTRETVQEWAKRGLHITCVGKRRFIRAEDFDKFLASQNESSVTDTTNSP